jgi:hypothetical protein
MLICPFIFTAPLAACCIIILLSICYLTNGTPYKPEGYYGL